MDVILRVDNLMFYKYTFVGKQHVEPLTINWIRQTKYTSSLIHSMMEFISKIRATKCSLNTNGIMICYSKTDGITVLQFDKYTSCAMLKRIGAVQDFISNGSELVILTTYIRPERYRLQLWNEFAFTYNFTLEMAQNIIQEYYRQKTRQYLTTRANNDNIEM